MALRRLTGDAVGLDYRDRRKRMGWERAGSWVFVELWFVVSCVRSSLLGMNVLGRDEHLVRVYPKAHHERCNAFGQADWGCLLATVFRKNIGSAFADFRFSDVDTNETHSCYNENRTCCNRECLLNHIWWQFLCKPVGQGVPLEHPKAS